MTWVVPTGKLCPGWCVLITVGWLPELSTAVGSVQVATPDGVPRDTVIVIGWGQPNTTGAELSTASTVKIGHLQHPHLMLFTLVAV